MELPAQSRLNAPPSELYDGTAVDELPSVAVTERFLALCQEFGSQRLAVRLVASGRNAGVSGLPASDDWTAWNAEEMRAAVEYLQRKRGSR